MAMRRTQSRLILIASVLCVLMEPASGFAQTSAGSEQSGLGEYSEAIDALAEADFQGAVRAASRAIRADEENARFYRTRGVAHVLSEQFDEAKRDFDRANRLEPGNKVTKIWLDAWTSMAQPGLGGGLNEVFPGTEVTPYQRLLTQTVFEYGKLTWIEKRLAEAKRRSQKEYEDEFKYSRGEAAEAEKARAWARSQFPAIADSYAAVEQASGNLLPAMIARVKSFYDNKEYRACVDLIDRIGASAPDDFTIAYYGAGSLLALRDYEDARNEYSRALAILPGHAYAMLGRGLANGRLGRIDRMHADFAAAKHLDNESAEVFLKSAAKTVAACETNFPKEPPSDLLAELYKKSADPSVSTDQLVEIAMRLRLAAAPMKNKADEQYSEQLFQRQSAVDKDPKNADKLAALAMFLADPVGTRPIETPEGPKQLRQRFGQPDTERAAAAADKALAIDPNNNQAIIAKALTLNQASRFNESRAYVNRALEKGSVDPYIVLLFLDLLTADANVLAQEAAYLRSPRIVDVRHYTEGDQDVTETTWRYPSSAELAKAEQLIQQANDIRRKASEPISRAIEAHKGTAEGYRLEAELESWRGNYDGQIRALKNALGLDKYDLETHAALVDIYPKINQGKQAIEHQEFINLYTTGSVSRQLLRVEEYFKQTRYRSARETLTQIEEIEPARSDIAASRAVLAHMDGDRTARDGFARAALAMEEARGRFAGRSILEKSGKTLRLRANDIGGAMIIHNQLAQWLQSEDDDRGALKRYQVSVALCDDIKEVELEKDIFFIMPSDNPQQPENSFAPARNPTLRELLVASLSGVCRVALSENQPELSAASYKRAIALGGQKTQNDLFSMSSPIALALLKKGGEELVLKYFDAGAIAMLEHEQHQRDNKRFFEEADQIEQKYQAKLNELNEKVNAVVEQMQDVQTEMSQTRDREKQAELRKKFDKLQSQMQQLQQELVETQRKMYEEQIRHNQSAP